MPIFGNGNYRMGEVTWLPTSQLDYLLKKTIFSISRCGEVIRSRCARNLKYFDGLIKLKDFAWILSYRMACVRIVVLAVIVFLFQVSFYGVESGRARAVVEGFGLL